MQVTDALAWLRRRGTRTNREGMARYGLPSRGALGVSMGNVQLLAKRLGRDHDLAGALWSTGVYEARLLACHVDDPAAVTATQMDAWVKDFDNWGTCDTACFVLFDRTPLAWRKVDQWARRRDEFQRRAAFALLASLALHDKKADEELFAQRFPLIERAAQDGRNFVKKGVSWALRAIGKRRALSARALEVARRLADSPDASSRWVGKDALRDLGRRAAG